MKKLTLLTLALAGLCALPALSLAEDAVPPKPPGGSEAPKAPADKPAAGKPAGGPERRLGAGGGGNPAERLKMLSEKLNLTPEQQEKVKAVYEKNGPQMREMMAKGRENLTDADKTKLRELMKDQMEEIGAILTPEQKEKMKELRAERGEGRGGKAK